MPRCTRWSSIFAWQTAKASQKYGCLKVFGFFIACFILLALVLGVMNDHRESEQRKVNEQMAPVILQQSETTIINFSGIAQLPVQALKGKLQKLFPKGTITQRKNEIEVRAGNFRISILHDKLGVVDITYEGTPFYPYGLICPRFSKKVGFVEQGARQLDCSNCSYKKDYERSYIWSFKSQPGFEYAECSNGPGGLYFRGQVDRKRASAIRR